MAPKVILCDLDGTIWDSFPWYAAALARETNGSADAIVNELRQGCSVVTLYRRIGVTDARFRQLCGACGDALTLYPGVHQALRALDSRGVATAVVTSLPARIAEPLLKCLGIRRFFRDVVNASNCAARKPSPVPLTFALDRIGVVPDLDVFYAGRPAEMQRLQMPRARFAWASYGYGGDCPCHSGVVLKSFDEVHVL
jgi:phosphoglycolate phosphatase